MRAETSLHVQVAEPWNELPYEQALELQRELTRAGRRGWLLFCCPETLTLGRRASRATDVVAPPEQLARLGVRVLEVDRGGQATYHGPGQIIGFPLGRLEDHVGDSRGARRFVEALETRLAAFVAAELTRARDSRRTLTGGELTGGEGDRRAGQAGVWVRDPAAERSARKIAALGLSFGREGIGHGFALNVFGQDRLAELIHPCGERGARPAALLPHVSPGSAEATAALRGVRERLLQALVAPAVDNRQARG